MIDLREHYTVDILRHAESGNITHEAWFKDGQLHRADGPALIKRFAACNIITHEEWWKDGQLHRADGPALIKRAATSGTVFYEAWFKDGQLHRAAGPALTMRDVSSGTVISEQWWKNGEQMAAPTREDISALQNQFRASTGIDLPPEACHSAIMIVRGLAASLKRAP